MTTRRLAGPAMSALLWSAATPLLRACPICFQIEQGPVSDGVRAAVVVLMAVTVVVLTGFGMFVARLVGAERLAGSANLGNPGTPPFDKLRAPRATPRGGAPEPRNPGTLGTSGTPEPANP